jgi:hypothetical protein
VVIEIILKNTSLIKALTRKVTCTPLLGDFTPLSVIDFGSLSAAITSAGDVQLLFQRLKPWEAFTLRRCATGFNIVGAADQKLRCRSQ